MAEAFSLGELNNALSIVDIRGVQYLGFVIGAPDEIRFNFRINGQLTAIHLGKDKLKDTRAALYTLFLVLIDGNP